MESKYQECVQIFTDGSNDLQKDAAGSAAAVPSNQVGFSKRAFHWQTMLMAWK